MNVTRTPTTAAQRPYVITQMAPSPALANLDSREMGSYAMTRMSALSPITAVPMPHVQTRLVHIHVPVTLATREMGKCAMT
jgi:hypothetical protein